MPQVFNQAALAIAGQIAEVSVMPQVVYKIMETITDSDISTGEIEKTISVDPGFSIKVLKMANSASYGLPRPVTTIREAVAFLGTNGIRQIAMAAGVFDMFLGKTDTESMRRRAWWRHSLDSAICARHIGRRFPGKLNVEEAYTCSLLHLLGKTIMDRVDPNNYGLVVGNSSAGGSETEAETQIFGCTHVEVAQAITNQWGLPQDVVDGLNYLTEPTAEVDKPLNPAVVAVSHLMAKHAISGISVSDQTKLMEAYPHWALKLLDLDDLKLQVLVMEGEMAISSAQAAA
ncbi:MAG: HDOD domain-containing protein [Chthonomonas sp.]|nr:HDOD domain-containing protein [Chthonomonas sp.]